MRLSLILLVLGCTPNSADEITRPFPDDFKFGAATAGFQVDMGCPTRDDCMDTNSDWYAWITSDEITESTDAVTGESIQNGPGMWELFEEDVQRMKSDGMTAYRMSLEWSRLFPNATDSLTTVEEMDAVANRAAVTRYHQMFSALHEAGIEPIVTVNHYTLPVWIHEPVECHFDPDGCPNRGWLDRERVVSNISLFAAWAGSEFGGEVDQWATLNEPFATTLAGYLQPGEDRYAPPGLMLHAEGTVNSVFGQVEAHAGMYDGLHANDVIDANGDGVAAEVGVVLNMVEVVPKNPDSPEDIQSAKNFDYVYHRVFLDGVTKGNWDDDLDGTPDRTRDDLKDRMDWLGINYYFRVEVQWLGGVKPLGSSVPVFDFLPTMIGTPDVHTGIIETIEKGSEYNVPIWITENGTSNPEEGPAFLDDNLGSIWTAIDNGADVRGYLYWSFVDNYEWSHGMNYTFGLYELDIDTKERTARPGLERYRTIMKQGGLE